MAAPASAQQQGLSVSTTPAWVPPAPRQPQTQPQAQPPAQARPQPGSVADLLRRADAGEQAAWDTLVERYTPLLWSVARGHRLGSADAADVVQTTWLRLVEHLGSINDPERLPGWLATTARRECLRVLRTSGREQVGTAADTAAGLVETLPADDPPVDERLLLDERDALLWDCFSRLSDRCRLLLRVLVATPLPSYAAVSEALGVPVGSLGPTRGRCIDRLRDLAAAAGLIGANDGRRS